MPIWVVVQPQRGVLLERAIFRVLGTLLGAGVGFAILQVFQQPLLVFAALSLWIALSCGLTHILRKVHAYIALTAGMTAAVVVLPSLLLPGRTFEIALARVECTLIGAFARAGRKTALAGIDANMCFMLASQAVLPAVNSDPSRIFSGAAALMLAAIMVASGFILLPRDSVSLASDAAREIVNDLRRLSVRTSRSDAVGWRPRALRQILRLMLHLGRAGNPRETAPQGMLAVLNLGNAIVDIQSLSGRATSSKSTRQALEEALGLLADFDMEPRSIASKLNILADRLGEAAAACALQDAAHALQHGATLIQMGRTGNRYSGLNPMSL